MVETQTELRIRLKWRANETVPQLVCRLHHGLFEIIRLLRIVEKERRERSYPGDVESNCVWINRCVCGDQVASLLNVIEVLGNWKNLADMYTFHFVDARCIHCSQCPLLPGNSSEEADDWSPAHDKR